ncbi:GNAT family N-acetyltransferase [Halococcus sp. AFM35]|uniref:GNAT family N-acetyltransferase n=1 Tax=Halococcus sp. AFM35 TaxID=3421653 RepID=UPI003EC0E993
MSIEAPDTEAAGAVADLWVKLAREQHAFGSHLRAEANRATIREAVVRDIIADGLLVAREEGEIVGFVMFGPDAERFEQDVSRGVVRNIVVRPDYRNAGIGAELLATAEAKLAESGFDVVSLSALYENRAARRFYARAGYEPHRIDLEKRLESDTDKPERR